MILKEFLASKNVRNAWIELDIPMKLYARKSYRHINGETIKALDIASVEVNEKKQGQGVFTGFLLEVENWITQQETLQGIYVESILNHALEGMLLKRGYMNVGGVDGCANMFKSQQAMIQEFSGKNEKSNDVVKVMRPSR